MAHAGVVAGSRSDAALQRALEQARRQGAGFWERYVKLLWATSRDPSSLDAALADLGKVDASYISLLAERVIPRLAELPPSSLLLIRQEAGRRRTRWQEALRLFLAHPSAPIRLNAGRLLEQVGSVDDVPRLRQLSRSLKGKHADPSLGRGLARALAPRVFIDDLSMVTMTIGKRRVRGTEVRRKPLALLCFLLTRQGWVATRDQVLDALWPDLEPDDGQNSLNQTLYFLRRVFDPAFDEDLSAPYVRLESDLIWLDQELVESRSSRCRALLQEVTTTQSSSALERLVGEYRGRFAIDFAYEDWSTAYRGTLHSAYLEAVERGVRQLLSAGEDGRAMAIARAALEVDPEADQVELSLLKIYRATGAHAAAAEQYGHYSDVLKREFEEEAPPLDSLE